MKIQKLQIEYNNYKKQLDTKMLEWEELSEALENVK